MRRSRWWKRLGHDAALVHRRVRVIRVSDQHDDFRNRLDCTQDRSIGMTCPRCSSMLEEIRNRFKGLFQFSSSSAADHAGTAWQDLSLIHISEPTRRTPISY